MIVVILFNVVVIFSDIVQLLLLCLKIIEIFILLQGEVEIVGWLIVFVCLIGCLLCCQYCDIVYVFYGGIWWDIDDIVVEVLVQGVCYVCVIGGELLVQKCCLVLLQKLCDVGMDVLLEIFGVLDVSVVDLCVLCVVDIKMLGLVEVVCNCWENLLLLIVCDQIKFVICSCEDYDWVKVMVVEYGLVKCCIVFFLLSKGEIIVWQLVDWIVEDWLLVCFQMQLYKILWNDEFG